MPQVMSRERFQNSTTFDQYLEQMQANQEKMAQFVDEVQISDQELEWWRQQGQVNVYILTFDGCGDALYNIPVIARVGRQCPNVDVRVVQRDENLDIMDRYLKEGLYRSVPCMIFMNENMEEIGVMKERADEMTRVMEAEMIAIRRRLREEHKDEWRGVIANTLKDIVGAGK